MIEVSDLDHLFHFFLETIGTLCSSCVILLYIRNNTFIFFVSYTNLITQGEIINELQFSINI